MSLTAVAKAELVRKFQVSENDSGATEVQVALLSVNISLLTEHLKVHKKDLHSRRGLIGMVNRRRKLLNYIKRKDKSRYISLIKRLNIRR